VERRGELLVGIAWLVGPPFVQFVRVRQAAEQDRLGRPRGADRADDFLHADRFVCLGRVDGFLVIRVGNRAAPVLPARPAHREGGVAIGGRGERLVEGVEQHGRVFLEGAGHRRPERRRVIVGQRPLAVGRDRPGRGPVQIEDRVDPVRVQVPHVGLDRLPVARDGEFAGGVAIDAQPAVLVQRNPHRVGVPRRDRGGIGGVERPGRVCVPVEAGVLGAHPVDPHELHGLAGSVHEVVAVDRDRERRAGKRGARGYGGYGGHGKHGERGEDREVLYTGRGAGASWAQGYTRCDHVHQ
jgi:hypothetical protein